MKEQCDQERMNQASVKTVELIPHEDQLDKGEKDKTGRKTEKHETILNEVAKQVIAALIYSSVSIPLKI